jgi:hypothetical protein
MKEYIDCMVCNGDKAYSSLQKYVRGRKYSRDENVNLA